MTSPEDDFDPDDNFANSHEAASDVDEEATTESLVWQLLLLINPGDEDTALQQFGRWQEAWAESGDDEYESIGLLRDVIDWKSGFHVEEGDAAAAVDSVNELASRWNLSIDWGVEDPSDDEFLQASDVPELLATAHDRLREYGYTLWLWETAETSMGDSYAGWMTHSRDDEALRIVASALAIEVRAAG